MEAAETALAKIDATSWLMIAAAVVALAYGNWQQLSKISGQFAAWFKPSKPKPPAEPGIDEIVAKLIESWKALVDRGEMEAAREVGEAIVSALGVGEPVPKPQVKRGGK